ncbi:MAG TPA: bifunctional hydroxymethylpyrimidine kinase/phosphomethylpyrimidine kinase [Hyphomicrobiaceae bacterium]|nr:bifunctional hydroxymethylpyrimidine kinase/phosphomethylpyrimidine kinase [Hyphomicrobiaceae bacterium]
MTRETATPVALTIAGSDSSGGAGIQADLKTFTAFAVYGASVLTALTAQNTKGVAAVQPIPASFVSAQIRAVFDDLAVGAAKTGMLANAEVVLAVAGEMERHSKVPLVVDPVMVSTNGDLLLEADAISALKSRLLPRADLITPNLPEAAALLGGKLAASEAEMAEQGRRLLELGCGAALVKGGHGAGAAAVDMLVTAAGTVRLESPRIETLNTHGTGCTLSAAIAALLAMGEPLESAVRRAKTFVTRAIDHGREQAIGHGRGPVDHLFAIRAATPPA